MNQTVEYSFLLPDRNCPVNFLSKTEITYLKSKHKQKQRNNSNNLVTLSCLIIRCYLFHNKKIFDWLSKRCELVTLENSHENILNANYLMRNGINVYDSSIIHQTPVLLSLLHLFKNDYNHFIFLLLLDIINAILIFLITHKILEKSKFHDECLVSGNQIQKISPFIKMNEKEFVSKSFLAFSLYLLCPIIIAQQITLTTTTIQNFFVLIILYESLKKNSFFASIFISFASVVISIYFILLIPPMVLMCSQTETKKKYENVENKDSIYSIYKINWTILIQTIIFLVAFLKCFIYCNYLIYGSYDFIQSTYLFSLKIDDMSPNVGVLWYLFLEMFEHFHLFFVVVMQIHLAIYCIPLSIRFFDHQYFVYIIQMYIIAIGKPNPCLGDTFLILCLIPSFYHLISYLQVSIVIITILSSCLSMMSVMWHIWLVAGSGNANFYFAITLGYSCAHIFFLNDLLRAFTRREFILAQNCSPTKDEETGEQMRIPWYPSTFHFKTD
ncbi:hypothetical protein SNEBB_006550 [Seison nebaliae]|nr:hypothetical protein SNEBB_006550 [Seison nebaliae]